MVTKKARLRTAPNRIRTNKCFKRVFRRGPIADCDSAIVSITPDGVYLYEYWGLVECFQNTMGSENAQEWVDFNIVRLKNAAIVYKSL